MFSGSPGPSSNRTPRPKPYTTRATRECTYCGREFNAKGYASHEKKCRAQRAAAARDSAYEARLAREEEERLAKRARTEEAPDLQDTSMRVDEDEISPDLLPDRDLDQNRNSNSPGPSYSPRHYGSDLNSPSPAPDDRDIEAGGNGFNAINMNPIDDEQEQEPELDDIKVEYHPSSNRRSVITHFQDFTRARASLDIPPAEEPYRPFRCRADFAFARIAFNAALKPDQINALIKLIYDVAKGETFTLTGHGDLAKIWKKASDILTPFEEVEITVPLLKKERKYKVWCRPLWDWTLDLLSDSSLFPHFTWDAERLYKHDGTSFIRFIDKPWTADRYWEIQSALPVGSYPLCWILYTDKNKLSSFGTAKGYPVIVRCANLPAEIRNGDGIGGGRVIGWLPVLKEEAAHTKKHSFKNHKRAVWHEALREMLKSLEVHSKEGYCFTGADGVERTIYPCILILSADYDEQVYMTLLRGLTGLAPCPVCLVPVDKQSDFSFKAPYRTAEDSKASFLKVEKSTLKDAEVELKPKGLRRVYNTFWRLNNSDPHKAVSWDRLHGYSIGIFGDHMWSDFKLVFDELGRGARTQIDKQFSLMPRFRNLHHFNEVVHIYFNDGSKFEDLAKQLLFAAHNVLTRTRTKHGYNLLKCLRSFLTLDTLLSFDVHTEDTIKAGEDELHNFSSLIEDYVSSLPQNTDKKFTSCWDFIKMHYQTHAFENIRAKGVTRNYNTKPNEKLHKPMRDAYHQRTNFKNIEGQILRVDHYLLVSNFIQSKLNELDEYISAKVKEDDDEGELQDIEENVSGHYLYQLCSPQKVKDVSDFEELNRSDPAYKNFRTKLAKFLTEFFQAHAIPLPNGRQRMQISPDDKIVEYRLIKVSYENMVTWKKSTDYLRCNPKFFNNPRYDSLIVRTVGRQIFARLICLINCIVEGKSYPVALIHPYDAPVGRFVLKDIDLGLTRVRAKPRIESEFIPAGAIVRGAVLVPDFDKDGEYLVLDVLDPDMFVRVRKMQNIW